MGLAAETREISVLLPALGKPTRAASASTFISSVTQVASPYSPCSENVGALRCGETNAALPRAAAASVDEFDLLSGLNEVGEHRSGLVDNHRAERNGQDQVFALAAMAQIAFAVGAIGGPPMGMPRIAKQSGGGIVGDGDHGTAAAARTAIGFAAWPTFDATKAGNSGSAVSAADFDADPVYEHGNSGSRRSRSPEPATPR